MHQVPDRMPKEGDRVFLTGMRHGEREYPASREATVWRALRDGRVFLEVHFPECGASHVFKEKDEWFPHTTAKAGTPEAVGHWSWELEEPCSPAT